MRSGTCIVLVSLILVPPSVPPSMAQEDFRSSAAFEREAIKKTAAEVDAKIQRAAAALKAEGQRTRDVQPTGPGGEEDVDEVGAASAAGNDRIVNGALTARYPSIGALLKVEHGKLGSWCTGTLIGCRTFVTAHHCVEDAEHAPQLLDFNQFRVFFQHAGLFRVTKLVAHFPYEFPLGDLAVLTLERDVEGIRPTPLYTGGPIADGTEGKIVGFGRTGGERYDYGLKRVGTIKTGACRDNEPKCVCWNYNATVALPGENSNTCNADSGGPLLVTTAGGSSRLLAGVTSGGSRRTCLGGDHSYDVDVRQFADWIKTQAGTDLGGAACAALPRVGGVNTKYFVQAVDLSPGVGKEFKIDVPTGIKLLRVTMNGEDRSNASGKPVTNFDLYVKQGSVATKDSADCKQNDSSQVGACEFANPVADRWFVRVDDQGTQAGSAQVVVTMFSQS